MQKPHYDLIGIGIGPANLSLAALSHELPELKTIFFDRKQQFEWHSGLSLDGARIQVSFLKDLVSLVDPTNPFSFVNYLSKHRRLYSYIAANLSSVSRQEFEDYYRWAAAAMPQLHFNSHVEGVKYHEQDQLFELCVNGETYFTKHLVMGTGLTPRIPACCEKIRSPSVFHASEFAFKTIDPQWKRIAIVGGGQTSGELFLHLLQQYKSRNLDITWITRRHNLLPMDDSPFVNEFFYPQYSEYFYGLDQDLKAQLIDEQRLASDGVSTGLLQTIYQHLYELRATAPQAVFPTIMSSTELLDMKEIDRGLSLQVCHEDSNSKHAIDVDAVILCTGYEYRIPEALIPASHRFEFRDHKPELNRDFSVVPKAGNDGGKLYMQNAGRHTRGVADPNLSLASWRSATILNSVLGRAVYDLQDKSAMMVWHRADKDDVNSSKDNAEKELANA